jgi:hypothetical protein
MRRRALIYLTTALVATGVVAGIASGADSVQTIQSGGISQIKVKTGAGPLTVGDPAHPVTGWIPIPGASATISVPTGKQAVFIARLSAHTLCQYRYDCDVRITVNGTPMQPDNGQFDATANYDGADLFASANDDVWQNHVRTMIRAAGPYPAGKYTVRAEAYLFAPGDVQTAVLELRNWQFEVERANS